MSICRLVLLLVALPALVQGQSLGDQARKERERREKARKAGTSSHVITEDELLSAPGRLANLPSAEEPSTEEPSAEAGTSTDAGTNSEENQPRRSVRPPVPRLTIPEPAAPPEPRTEQSEGYWRARADEARGRLRLAEVRYRLLDRAIRIGQPHMYENGLRVIYSPQQMKAMADAAQADVDAARKALDDLLEQARRAGALPGWLRER